MPTGRLHALVMASAGKGDTASHWRRYLKELGEDRADEGERRLYPLVLARIDRAALTPDELEPLRSARRAAMARQEIVFAAAARAEALFGAIGVRPILQKGCALQVRIYGDDAVRASSDLDIFIPPDTLEACLAVAREAGWARTESRPRTASIPFIARTQTRLTFQTPEGVEVDLHWSPRQVLEFDPRASARFAADARDHDFRGRSWRIPSDSWLLFETIEHGMAWNRVTPIRWVADALRLIDSPDVVIDWDLLGDLADDYRLRLTFGIALEVLARYSDRVPPSLPARLPVRPTLRERLYTRCRLKPPPAPLFGWMLSASHLLLRGPGGPLRRIARWPTYYRETALKCLSWSDVARRATEKMAERT